jgi:PAS domain S-box-containing protein
VYLNPAGLAASGMTAADIIGKTHREAGFSDDLVEFWEPRIQHVFDAAETVQTQFDWESPDGLVTLDWMLVPEFDEHGQVFSVLGVSRDITDLRRGQAALAHERYLLHTLMDNVPDAIYFKDAQGRFLRVNRAHAAHFGLDDPRQVVGKTDRDSFSAEHAEQAYADELAVMRTGAPLMQEERETWPDGHESWVITSKFPFRDENGNIIGTFGLSKDITERKRQEEERLELERRLLQAQKLESLGVLAGGIAHDFNNLLMAILGNLDLALDDIPSTSAREMIQEALHAARRAADLTRQMLAYAGKGRFVVSRVDLGALVVENAHLFRTIIPKTITLNLCPAQGLPMVEADAGQLQQVVMNLLTNAYEAIGEQPGEITLETGLLDCDAAYLSASSIGDPPPAGWYAYVQVRDSGSGMDEETQQRIFEPFFTTKFMGRGLGMAAVQGVMRSHGGALLLESAVGQGTTVRVLFPVAASDPAPAPRAADEVLATAGAAQGGLRGTVLVVDDEPEVRQVCATMVRRLGFDTLTAEDGPSAISIVRQHAETINAVILDLSMPKMDGLATLQELLRYRPGLKVLLSSGYNEQQATLHYTGQGLAGFIQKPYRLATLRAELTRLMGRDA